MKFLIGLVTSVVLVPIAAHAQTAAATSEAMTTVNSNSPIEAIAATAAGKAALEKHIPEILPHPAYEQFKTMTLSDLAPLAGGIITDEKIAAIKLDLSGAGSSSATAAAEASAERTAVTSASPIEALAATTAGKAALERHIPEILPHPAYEQFKAMTLSDLAPLAGGIITEEKIEAIDADLKASK